MQYRPTIQWLTLGILLALANTPCSAQVERYELGKRLRRFEEAWQIAAPEIRLKSTSAVQQAVSHFFGLQLKKAASKLDQAWLAVKDGKTSDWQRAGIAYRIEIKKTIFQQPAKASPEAGLDKMISIKLQPFYETKEHSIPGDTQVRIDCYSQTSNKNIQTTDTDFDSAKQGIVFDTNAFEPGDYRIRCRLQRDDGELKLLETSFSVLSDLAPQVANMEQVRRDKNPDINASVRATLSEYQSLIQQGQEPFSAETDYPFFQILKLANRIVDRPQDAPSQIGDAAQINDVWMVLTEGRKRIPVRLRAPQNQSGKIPVLFLFHGAGGSENMFFETYGAGQAVKMGLERGWLVVAPRQGLMGMTLNCNEMLNALEAFFEIDRGQVFLLGHSMGAAQVINQVSLNPDLPRAAAAIGGGRPPHDAKKIASVPWFVSAGELDFGRGGAKGFHQSLVKAGAANTTYLEIPGIEHMVIVQAALPQAFEFFDRVVLDR